MTIALVLVALGGIARAEVPAEPLELVRSTVEQVMDVLRDPALQRANQHVERVARIRQIADHIFDWKELARRSLGAPWQKITEEQRRRFIHLFTDRIAEKYMEDIDRFRGDEKVLVEGSQAIDEHRRVHTVLVTHSRERVPIDYFMHETPEGWRVYDFSVEGVSLVNHYRGTFSRYLVNHGFDQLLQRIAHPDQAPEGTR